MAPTSQSRLSAKGKSWPLGLKETSRDHPEPQAGSTRAALNPPSLWWRVLQSCIFTNPSHSVDMLQMRVVYKILPLTNPQLASWQILLPWVWWGVLSLKNLAWVSRDGPEQCRNMAGSAQKTRNPTGTVQTLRTPSSSWIELTPAYMIRWDSPVQPLLWLWTLEKCKLSQSQKWGSFLRGRWGTSQLMTHSLSLWTH